MNSAVQYFAKSEVIIAEGARGDGAYLIKSGSVLIYLTDEQGQKIPVQRLGGGDTFGEMYLLSPDFNRSASVVALEDCVLEAIAHDDMLEGFSHLNQRQIMLNKTLVQRVCRMNDLHVLQKEKS